MRLVIVPLFLTFLFGAYGVEYPRIATSQYNNFRTGANTQESILTPQNVNRRSFGKIGSLSVDGDVYAQPLFLPHVSIPGRGIHNLLFVATEHNSVYAFDADAAPNNPLWHVNLSRARNSLASTVAAGDVQCPFINPEIGIASTPVIDINTGTIFVLARLKTWRSSADVQYSQQLHALAITTGAEKFGGPVEIRAAVQSLDGRTIKFDALRENPRAALLLSRGSVFLTWASSCDVGPYHGWVMAYDARTLKQQAVLNTSPDSSESGIWMSDTGPAADSQGNVYLVTGNGLFQAGRDYGDSALKLTLRGDQLVVADQFTPADQRQLNATDGDLGSGGPLLVPGGSNEEPAALLFGGKAGVVYVLLPSHMGGIEQAISENSATQRIALSSGIYSAPAYWNQHVYYYGERGSLTAFAVRKGKVISAPRDQSSHASALSGATPTISALGNRNGIVWFVETKAWNDQHGRSVLHAYDALDVRKQLYASDQEEARDRAGEALRFVIPTVAGGRVYVGLKKAVAVYGLLPNR
jgi:hypothetical protein